MKTRQQIQLKIEEIFLETANVLSSKLSADQKNQLSAELVRQRYLLEWVLESCPN